MSHRAAALTACCAIAAFAIPSLADSQHLRAGDRLTYDVTVQVEEHAAAARGGGQTDTSTGMGTETLDVVAVDADGTAHGNLSVDMLGYARGAPVFLRKTVAVTVTPAGEIKPAASIDPLLDQNIALANSSVRDLAGRDLQANPTWRWSIAADSYPMTIALNRQTRGQQVYQGLPTFVVQTTGGGAYADDSAPIEASVSLAGTYYYDQRDGIIVGQAVRSDSVISEKASKNSTDATALVTVVLRTFTRGAPAPVEASPSPPPAAEDTGVPVPAAVPTQYEASPYPTVTPSL